MAYIYSYTYSREGQLADPQRDAEHSCVDRHVDGWMGCLSCCSGVLK